MAIGSRSASRAPRQPTIRVHAGALQLEWIPLVCALRFGRQLRNAATVDVNQVGSSSQG